MDRWQSTLGLAMRARKVVMGDASAQVHSERAGVSSSSSQMTAGKPAKKITDKCAFYHVPLMRVESGAMIDAAVGKSNRKAAAIIDQGFAKTIQSYMKG